MDVSCNLDKNIRYKYVSKLFEVVWLHLYTVIPLCRLDENEKLLEIFEYSSNIPAFYWPELNL